VIPEAKGPNAGAYKVDIRWSRPTGRKVYDPELDERVDEVEDRIEEAVAADEELATQLEGEEGEQLLDMFRAQTLTVLIQTRIILDGAADMGVEPTEEDIAEARQELVDELGGDQELEEAMAQAGLSEEALADQLQGVAALNVVGDRLVEEGEVEEPPEAPEGAEELDPADLAVQQWLAERMAGAEVAVHPEYGQWDPQSGQVMPAGGPVMPEMPEEEPLPDE
jgi:hypothetical protein